MSKQTAKAARKRMTEEMSAWQKSRDALRVEYDLSVKLGNIKPPSDLERLGEAAKGTGEQAEAARRVMEKRKSKMIKAEQTWSGHPLHRRMKFRGLDVSIENDAGSVRRGTDPDGAEWETRMKCPYGYIRRTVGGDGEKMDCFVGPNEDADNVTIVFIKKPGSEVPDEEKVMFGFDSEEDAISAWGDHHDVPTKYFQGAVTMPFDEFKRRHVVPRDQRMRAIRMDGKTTVSGNLQKARTSVIDGFTVVG